MAEPPDLGSKFSRGCCFCHLGCIDVQRPMLPIVCYITIAAAITSACIKQANGAAVGWESVCRCEGNQNCMY
jgi:hypothetical protein